MILFRAFFGVIFVAMIAVVVGAQNSRIPDWILKEKFLRACEDGDVETVKALLKLGISPNVRDPFNQPALMRAVRGFDSYRDTRETVRILLAAGADINATNDFGSTPIFLSVNYPKTETNPHSLLLRSGADMTRRNKYGMAFQDSFDLIKMDPAEEVWRLLIETEGGLSAPWERVATTPRYVNSATFAMAGAYYGETIFNNPHPILPLKIQTEIDKNGETYLFYYASRKRIGFDELNYVLPEAANVVTPSGETALMRAAKFDNGFVVKKLLMSGARPDIRDKSGKTALDYAAGYDYFDAAFMLLAKANANLADPAGRTPLMTAVANSSLKTVLAYVAAFEFEQNAAAEAASKTAEERKEMLTVAAAFRKINMNLRDTEGKTALMLAAAKGNAEVVKALLTMKPNRKLADKSGKTALEIARANGHAEIAKLLSGR